MERFENKIKDPLDLSLIYAIKRKKNSIGLTNIYHLGLFYGFSYQFPKSISKKRYADYIKSRKTELKNYGIEVVESGEKKLSWFIRFKLLIKDRKKQKNTLKKV